MDYPRWKFWRHALEIDKVFYKRWNEMHQRLRRNPLYKNIKCLRKDFNEFYNDMYESYLTHYMEFWRDETTLDRIDSNLNYCKDNCRRATRLQQSQNRNYNKNYTIGEETHCIEEWKRILWLSYRWFMSKIDLLNKWLISTEDMLDANFSTVKTYLIIDWIRYSSIELQHKIGIWRSTLNQRYKKYQEWLITKDDLFAPPKKWSSTAQLKCILFGKEFLISELADMANTTRDTIARWYKSIQRGEKTEEDFKNHFNLLI